MKRFALIFLILASNTAAWAEVSLQYRGVFPNEKVFVVGDADPASPFVSIVVLKTGTTKNKIDYTFNTAGKKNWEQELVFAEGRGRYGVHVMNQKTKATAYNKIAQLACNFGLKLNVEKTSDSQLILSGLATPQFQMVRVLVKKKTDTDDRAQSYNLMTGGKEWQQTLILREGLGEYLVQVLGGPPGETDKDVFLGQFFVQNLDAVSHPDLMASARVQSEDPRIQTLAQQIVGPAESTQEKIKLVHDWVAKNISYDMDLYHQTLEAPTSLFMVDALTTLQNRSSICEGYSSLIAALLRSQKIPTRIIHGRVGQGEHSWNEVLVDNRWLVMDSTWDAGTADLQANGGRGVFTPAFREKYFDPTPEIFAQDHQRTAISPN